MGRVRKIDVIKFSLCEDFMLRVFIFLYLCKAVTELEKVSDFLSVCCQGVVSEGVKL